MELKFLKMKEWLFNKVNNESRNYHIHLDFDRDENGMMEIEDGCVFAHVEEVLGETEKAIKVRLASGECVGSTKGWTTWLPKSCVEFVA